jgi:hypothetical protein
MVDDRSDAVCGRDRFRRLRTGAWTVCFALLVSNAWAVDVVDVRWGFDGKVVRNRFNLLSVLVNNPHPEAFDGELVLHKQMGGGQRVDAPVVESVFVGPFGERWVPFYPYVGNDWEEWELEVRPKKGRRGLQVKVNAPRTGWPARVLIETAKNPAKRTLPVKKLPEVLFPPFVTATDALQAVLFDAPPDWDEPRRVAFLDWLYRGGTAFVLNDATGNAPVFPASLGVLNSPLENSTYGTGRVIRVSLTRFELDPPALTRMFSALPRRLVVDREGLVKEQSAVDIDEDLSQRQASEFQDSSDPLSANSFLARLRGMTRPKHNWALLHLLFWSYIALVFPGCYLMGRKWTDYRVVYVSLLAVVVVFSLLFGLVGQRGYGESTKIHSVAIARPLPDGHLDVSEWSNAFVTMGGDYTFQHPGVGALYSTCNITELVKGSIRNGAEAEFQVDIPPFSSREFAHRVKVQAKLPQLTVERCEIENDQLRALTIATDAQFPQNEELITALYRNRFYSVNRVQGKLQLGSGLGSVAGYLRVQDNNYGYYNPYGPGWGQQERPAIEEFRDLFTPLIARSVNVSRMGDAEALSVPEHVVRLFYFGPITPEFAAQSKYLNRNEGWVLYAVDLPAKLEIPAP